MSVKEVDDLAGVLPGPGSEDPGTVDGVLAHVVVEEGVEVDVGHGAHLSLQPLHLQLRLVVHLPDQLLSVLQLHPELLLLLAEEVGSLLEGKERGEMGPRWNLHA